MSLLNAYAKRIEAPAPNLTKKLNDARAEKNAADAEVLRLEQELHAAQCEVHVPCQTEHEWCVALQRSERNVSQHKANLDYLKARWIEQEFCSIDEAEKGRRLYKLLKQVEELDYILAKANHYKLKMQYQQACMGDYDETVESLCNRIRNCLCQVDLTDELKHNVYRVIGYVPT